MVIMLPEGIVRGCKLLERGVRKAVVCAKTNRMGEVSPCVNTLFNVELKEPDLRLNTFGFLKFRTKKMSNVAVYYPKKKNNT